MYVNIRCTFNLIVDNNNNNVIEIICDSVLQTSHFRPKKTHSRQAVNEEKPIYKRVNMTVSADDGTRERPRGRPRFKIFYEYHHEGHEIEWN